MTRDELAALRDAIDTVLTWPPAVLAEVARWLSPPAAKPNGHDPHPPTTGRAGPNGPPEAGNGQENGEAGGPNGPPGAAAARQMTPRPAKARRNTSNTPTAEQKLIAALEQSPSASISRLAKAAGANRTSTRERLQLLADRGAVTRDGEGRWRLTGEESRPMPALSSN